MEVVLRLPSRIYEAARRHLLPEHSVAEQGGFLFAQFADDGTRQAFSFMEWMPLGPDDYAEQHEDHLELADHARARVIKRAHDLGACLVEFHSHPGPYPAAFSEYDMLGFEEFVPHVRWRLKARPYAAIVIAPSGFDALAWIDDPAAPARLNVIETDAESRYATGLTLKRHRGVNHGAV